MSSILADETKVERLGECTIESPIAVKMQQGSSRGRLVEADEQVRFRIEINSTNQDEEGITFEKAGPREKIFFEPSKTTAAIVTCGGISPGLNNVIRSLVFELYNNYGVPNILGFRYGYLGFLPQPIAKPLPLTPEVVKAINQTGGSILGCSRGPIDPEIIVDTLVRYGVDILFTLGGDGTQRGAQKIVEEIKRRDATISVVGIPKTIDNDVPFVWETFGFATAVEQARNVIKNAVTEVGSFLESVAVVKLMGRDAGFISARATLASQDVDFCLIPEVNIVFEGEDGLLAAVERRIRSKGSCIIVVSEGAGQEFFQEKSTEYDKSGNKIQHDIGLFLKEKLLEYLKSKGMSPTMRYFDPTYSVRSVPANVSDAYFSDQLARAAVHAGMAGRTNMIIGLWYNTMTHVPIPLVCKHHKRINPKQELWRDVLAVTGQS